MLRITPIAIALRSGSAYFNRAFSACPFFLRGFDSGVSTPLIYLKSSHRSTILGMRIYSTGCSDVRNVMAHSKYAFRYHSFHNFIEASMKFFPSAVAQQVWLLSRSR